MIHYKPEELVIVGNQKCGGAAAVIELNDDFVICGNNAGCVCSLDPAPELGELVDEVSVEPGELVESAKSMYKLYICEEPGEQPVITVSADPPDQDAEESEHVLSPLELDHEEEINESEVNLYNAVVNFLHAVLDINPATIMTDHEDVVEDFLEHALKYLYLKHGFDIYRPMVLEMDDGAEVYKDFPYSLLDLSDEEKNPVFMPE